MSTIRNVRRAFVAIATQGALTLSAHAASPDYLSRFMAADNEQKLAYCALATSMKATSLRYAAMEHGGLDIAAAESAWKEIDKFEIRGLVFYRLLHMLGEQRAAAAEATAQSASVETGLADRAVAREQQLKIGEVCADIAFDAMVAKDARIKLIESNFRDTLKSDRAELKADFIGRAIAPYHD